MKIHTPYAARRYEEDKGLVKELAKNLIYVCHMINVKPSEWYFEMVVGDEVNPSNVLKKYANLEGVLVALMTSMSPKQRKRVMENRSTRAEILSGWWLSYLKHHPELEVEVLDDAN